MKFSGLAALTVGTFAIGTDLYLVSGILPSLAAGLGVPAAEAGGLAGLFALAFALGAPVLAALTSALPRRRVLILSLGLFAASNLACAWAPDYGALALARVACAFAACLYLPNAAALIASAEAPERRGASLGLLMAGLNVATVLGVPLGIAVNAVWGWRAAFLFVALVAGAAALWVRGGVPPVPAGPKAGLGRRLRVLGDRNLLPVLGTTVLALTGAFTVYTYLAVLLADKAGIGPDGLAALVAGYGVLGIIGSWAGGRAADLWGPRKTLGAVLGLLTVLFAGMGLGAAQPAVLSVLVLGWGLVGAAFTPVQQLRVVRVSPEAGPGALALHSSAVYLGQALAAGVGALVVSNFGPGALGWAALPFFLGGLALVLVPALPPRLVPARTPAASSPSP